MKRRSSLLLGRERDLSPLLSQAVATNCYLVLTKCTEGAAPCFDCRYSWWKRLFRDIESIIMALSDACDGGNGEGEGHVHAQAEGKPGKLGRVVSPRASVIRNMFHVEHFCLGAELNL